MRESNDVNAPSPLATVDLNLLTALRAIDDARSVTRAAKALGLSQPALSHTLARLRDTFDDPLFAKTSKGMVPTPKAETILPHVRRALADLERDVFGRKTFDPATLARTFRIQATDLVEGLVMPELLRGLDTDAKGVRIAVTPVGVNLPKDALESGAVDFALAGFFGDLPEGFRSAPLFEDTFTSAVRLGHPRLGRRKLVDLETYLRERHVLVAPSGELSGAVDRALAKKKRSRHVSLGTSGFWVAGWVTSSSDAVVTAPSRLLSALAKPLGLRVFPTPLDLPPIRVVMVWHARNDADPAHGWFRKRLGAAAQR
ncbi:MAG: LysR family transcriptional regulator [Polyangiaceae bacterium]